MLFLDCRSLKIKFIKSLLNISFNSEASFDMFASNEQQYYEM